MTIATWNIERVLTKNKRFTAIQDHLQKLNADILILTETNAAINPGDRYTYFHSVPLPPGEYNYHADERRVSIYSKYEHSGSYETFDRGTSICHAFNTPLGTLAVYATIIGITGNRDKNFNTDIDQQIGDFKSIAAQTNLCISGDFNTSFSDSFYFTKEGREKLSHCFSSLELYNVTAAIPENIDHIVLPKAFVAGKEVTTSTWNDSVDEKVSDHKGVAVVISEEIASLRSQ